MKNRHQFSYIKFAILCIFFCASLLFADKLIVNIYHSYSPNHHTYLSNPTNHPSPLEIFDIKKAHADNTKKHMIIQGLEDGGSGSQWVHSIWTLSISLVNIVLIGILIYLGVVNILHLNYETYELKKFLVPLIIAVIFANLSLFVCRAVVELSSALSETFIQDQREISENIMQGLGFSKMTTLADLMRSTGSVAVGTITGIAMFLGNTLVGIVVSIVVVAVFLIISLLLYVRVFVVLLLAAISPLAFISMVIPATQQYFKQWWSWFLKWVFMGPIIALILKVAAVIGGQDVTVTGITDGGSFFTMVFSFIAIIGLLILAILTPFVIGGMMQIPGMKQLSGFLGNRASKFYKENSALQSLSGRFASKGKAREEEAKYARMVGEAKGLGVLDADIKASNWGHNISDHKAQRQQKVDLIDRQRAQERIGSQVDKEQTTKLFEDPSKMRQLKHIDLETYINTLARQGDLDQSMIENIEKNFDQIKGGKKDKKNNRSKFEKIVSSAMLANSQAQISKNMNPTDLSNSFIKDGHKRQMKNLEIKENIEKMTSSPRARARIANDSVQTMSKMIDDIDEKIKKSNNDAEKKELEKQKDEVLQKFNEIDLKVNQDPAYSSLKQNPAFVKLQRNHSITSKLQNFTKYFVPGNELADQSKRNRLQQVMVSNIPIEDPSGAINEESIRKIAQFKQILTDKQKLDGNTLKDDFFDNTSINFSDQQKAQIKNSIEENLRQLGGFSDDSIKKIIQPPVLFKRRSR
jgi:MFS family permease